MPKTQEDLEKEQKILEHKRQLEEDAIKKDLDERYPNYRKDWDYDPYEHVGEHIPTGFRIGDVLLDIGRRFEYHNWHEFSSKMKARGMNEEEIDTYRRDLKNQFYFIDLAEAIWTPKPKTFEEKLSELKEDYAWMLQAVKDQGDRTKEEIQKLSQFFDKKIQDFISQKGNKTR